MTKRTEWLALYLACTIAAAPVANAQWSTTYETFYLQAPHNWVFRNNYQSADRLFNAFDYGHAILYETLLTKPNAPVSELEEKVYNKLTREVLVRPPRVPLEEAAIEIKYAQLAPEAKVMFDWSHILHRQIYDVLADERLEQTAKDREVQRLIGYYKTRRDVAFSSKPKSMKLMQEQPYSLAFRERFPKFNGLIWGYHWLQVGLYEPLMTGTTREARQAGVRATAARFWQMLADPMSTLPYQMPMTAAVSPTFAARYPEAAIIFDNLHSMHDVVSDILANPKVPRDRKRAEILLAASRFRDDSSYVMSEAAWRTMSIEMGLQNMGGASVNFTSELPAPTVTRGAVMQHDDLTGKMTGMKTGAMTGSMAEMDHAAMGHVMPAIDTMVTSDSVAVLGVVNAFHKALVAGDSALALSLLSPELVVLESGGVENFAEFRQNHLPADIAFARAVPSVRGSATVIIKGGAAWVSSTSSTEGTFRERPVNSVGAELVVLSKGETGWKISAIHWSSRARR
ncbi:MAG: nuclear transport factor 2 family protein [Phycisphaerae bacterium]|nr:nuclear transport factor 2 family protein [Gemmatimonadaceae bacterium]